MISSRIIAAAITFTVGLMLSVSGIQSASAALISGTTSVYYLNNYATGTIYAVQGTGVIGSFSTVYRGSQGEGTLAVSDVISTRSFYGGTLNDFYDGLGGTYSLTGTPTGTTYANDSVAPGRTGSHTYDGTSDGISNFAVEYATNGTGDMDVIVYDKNWQNPQSLFTVASSSCCQQLSIAHDSTNNSLWIGGWGASTIWNYSMAGALLSSFNVGHFNNAALGFDAADGTLWLSVGQGNNFEQWSTSGVLLQSGAFSGIASGSYLSGDFAASAAPLPGPGALALLGIGLLSLGIRRRYS